MNKLKLFLLASLVCAAGVLAFGAIAKAAIKPQEPAPVVSAPTINGLLVFTNKNRQTPLVLDERLNKSAQAKCEDMVTGDYYGHVAPNSGLSWTTFIQHELGERPPSSWWGENLNKFMGYPTSKGTVDSWMESPEHRKNIENTNFHKVGFATCSTKDKNTILVVQHFAS